MAKTQVNINSCRVCAFCKFWWDPACRYIVPFNGVHWFYDSSVRCRCIKKNVDTLASSTCGNYKPKIELN